MKKTVSLIMSLVLMICLFAGVSGSALAAPTITKDPGGETVSELGTAMFVSRADNASEITWYLVAPRGVSYEAEQVTDLFPSMAVAGQGTQTLTLYTIPTGFSGWKVECHFKDANGEEAVSQQAEVTISTTLPPTPTVTQAPEKAWLLYGQRITLSVYANPPVGNTIKYQWYATESNDPATATLIPDATTPEYTPPEKDGTVYYCVGLRSVNDTNVSTLAFTPLVPVTYSSEPEVPDHVHTYSDMWENDEIYHWHVCTGCGEIADRATHSYTWTETVKPTSRKQGERVGVCSVCGYETTQVVPAQTSERSSSGKGLLVALLVLVIAMLAAGAYYYVRYYRTGTPFNVSDITKNISGRSGRSRGRTSSAGRHSGAQPPAEDDFIDSDDSQDDIF